MKATTTVGLTTFMGMAAILLFLFFVRRSNRNKKLNKAIGGQNKWGDQTKYLKFRSRLWVRPIVAFDIEPHLKTLSAHFLNKGERYNFVVPSSFIMSALGYGLCCVKTLRPIPRPRISKKALKTAFFPLGETLTGKTVNMTLSNTSLVLILGTMGSGKSRLGYLVVEALSRTARPPKIYVVDLTSAFPRRICDKAGAVRITTAQNLLALAKELTKENERRQVLLKRFDIDHYQNLPKEHLVQSIAVVIDEAHLLFQSGQDGKSEKGKRVVEIATLLNDLIFTGRKTGLAIIYLSQSALKSDSLIKIGKSPTIITGYLSPSESEALLEDKAAANNPGLTGGVFVIRSSDFLEPTIFRSYRYDDSELKIPRENLEEEEPPTGIEPNP